MKHKALFIIGAGLMAVFVFGAFHVDLLRYAWMQGKGQISILLEARPIDIVLADPDFPDSLKSKIRLIEEIKLFAQKKGFSSTDNYQTLYDQKGQVALWNLSACEPYSFSSYEWTFPFLGSFGYKGFFELEKAKAAQKELVLLGYDTRIRSVGAWSTLGWFQDPIMSNMLTREEGELAETILHELTHATVFFKDSLDFNENLASFIGEIATIDFLKSYFGPSSDQLTSYINQNEDTERFREHLLRGKENLDSLYATFSPTQADRAELKKEMIQKIVDQLDTIPFHNKIYSELFENQLPNNAYFMSFQRYHASKNELNELYAEFDENLMAFLTYLHEQQ